VEESDRPVGEKRELNKGCTEKTTKKKKKKKNKTAEEGRVVFPKTKIEKKGTEKKGKTSGSRANKEKKTETCYAEHSLMGEYFLGKKKEYKKKDQKRTIRKILGINRGQL